MGLDITAYKNVKLVESPEFDEDGDITHPENGVKIYGSGAEHPWVQADDLEVGQVYEYEGRLSGYRSPYSTYSTLRDELARIAGYEEYKNLDGYRDGRFYAARVIHEWVENDKQGLLAELIFFSDCDGEIGTKTCRKILADLMHVQKLNDVCKVNVGKLQYQDKKPLDPRNERLLDDLVETFVYAAQDGFVRFH